MVYFFISGESEAYGQSTYGEGYDSGKKYKQDTKVDGEGEGLSYGRRHLKSNYAKYNDAKMAYNRGETSAASTYGEGEGGGGGEGYKAERYGEGEGYNKGNYGVAEGYRTENYGGGEGGGGGYGQETYGEGEDYGNKNYGEGEGEGEGYGEETYKEGEGYDSSSYDEGEGRGEGYAVSAYKKYIPKNLSTKKDRFGDDDSKKLALPSDPPTGYEILPKNGIIPFSLVFF